MAAAPTDLFSTIPEFATSNLAAMGGESDVHFIAPAEHMKRLFTLPYVSSRVAFPVHRVTHARDPVPHMPSAASGFSHVGTEVFFNKASSAYKVCARGEDPSCAASVVVASGVDDHASYMGESFAAKHLECALAPSSSKSLEAAAKALAA